MSHTDLKKRRPSRLWHRWLGFLLVVPLLFVALTGILLNHADQLGWNQKPVQSRWILSRYGMTTGGEPVSFKTSGILVSEWSGQLFWNDRALEAQDNLQGAVTVSAGVAVVSTRAIRLFDSDGTLIETLDEASLPEGALQKAGVDGKGRLVVQTATDQDWEFDEALIGYARAEDASPRWAESVPTPDPLRQSMSENYQGDGVPWSRVLLDMHSGRFFGSVGSWIVDMTVILLVILSITGLMVGVRALRQGANKSD